LIHLIGGDQSARSLRLINLDLGVDFPSGNRLGLLLKACSAIPLSLLNQCVVLLNPGDCRVVRLLGDRDVCRDKPLIVCRVIVDHCVVNDRGRSVGVDEGRMIDVGDSDISVTV
jgi:hypothetical protein